MSVIEHPRASIEQKVRDIIADHYRQFHEYGIADPNGLANDVLAIVNDASETERSYLERLGLELLTLLIRSEPDDSPPL